MSWKFESIEERFSKWKRLEIFRTIMTIDVLTTWMFWLKIRTF